MKRGTAPRRPARVCAVVTSTRTVWSLKIEAALPLVMKRISPRSSWSSPSGGAAQPTSTWPDMTWVSVATGLPVATSLALRPYCLTMAVTTGGARVPRRGLGTGGPNRGAVGVGAGRTHDTDRAPDVAAAGDHRLLGLAAALRIEQLEFYPMPPEHATALADLGDGGRPVAVLPDRELEPIL